MAAAKKSSSYGRTKKRVEKVIKRSNKATLFLCVAALVIGIAAGAFAYIKMSENDRFELIGDKEYTILVGEDFTYSEEGAVAIALGRDVSGTLSAVTDIPKDENGAYKIDTSAEGVYKIVYTVDSLKYKNIERIRVFRVVGGEEIG